MRVSNGVVVTDVEVVCESWASFYQYLFTACPVDLGVQLDLLISSVDDAACCAGPISPNEAHAALLGMAKSKSPGSDGLSMEFYVAFWDLLVGILLMFSILLWSLASCLSLSVRRSLP